MHSCSPAPSPSGRPSEGDRQANLPAEETSQSKDAPVALPESQDEEEEGVAEGSNKFYCYLCSITCHNQQVGWTLSINNKILTPLFCH